MSENTVTNLRIKKNLDAKIKEIATKTGRTKTEIYEEAVLNYIERESQEELIRDGKIEELLNSKINNIDKQCELWCRSQMLLRSRVAVAVA